MPSASAWLGGGAESCADSCEDAFPRQLSAVRFESLVPCDLSFDAAACAWCCTSYSEPVAFPSARGACWLAASCPCDRESSPWRDGGPSSKPGSLASSDSAFLPSPWQPGGTLSSVPFRRVAFPFHAAGQPPFSAVGSSVVPGRALSLSSLMDSSKTESSSSFRQTWTSQEMKENSRWLRTIADCYSTDRSST